MTKEADHDRNRGDTTEVPAAAPPEWVLMVHMLASAPNLREPLGLDLEELSRPLREQPTRENCRPVEVYVQIDAPTGISKRFRLTATEPETVDVFPTRPSTTLKEFVDYGIARHPRTKGGPPYTALVVWGHASGSGRGTGRAHVGVGNSVGNPTRRLVPAAGDSAAPGAEVAQAGSVWAQLAPDPVMAESMNGGESLPTPRLDLVGFDACYMACIEVAYELRGAVRYLLAPQPGIGLDGWHYDLLLDQIIAGRRVDAATNTRRAIQPEELGTQVVAQVGLTATSPQALSLLDLHGIGDLADEMEKLTKALKQAYDAAYRESQMRRLIHDAFDAAAWAGVRQFLDLGDLCRLLASRIPDRSVRRAALSVLAGIARTNGGTQPLVDHLSVLDIPLSGLSIYCPWVRSTAAMTAQSPNIDVDQREYRGDASAGYVGLRFPKKSWGDFMFDTQRLRSVESRWFKAIENGNGNGYHYTNGSRPTSYAMNGRPDDSKPAGRLDDSSKPAGRLDDSSKPAGRADDTSKPAGRDDTWTV